MATDPSATVDSRDLQPGEIGGLRERGSGLRSRLGCHLSSPQMTAVVETLSVPQLIDQAQSAAVAEVVRVGVR